MPDQMRPQELLESLRRLSDDELVARLKSLAARERRATALVVAHLAELDTRDVHLRAGCPTLFIYCRVVLALSEHEAYNRIEVARTARRFPVVLDLLAEGAVNLTTVRLLGPHLTADNHAAVLESARGKRKPEVEEIVACLAPRPDVPASVRKLPARTVAAASTGDSSYSADPPAIDPRSSAAACAVGPRSSAAAPQAPPQTALPIRAESTPPPTGSPYLAEHAAAAAAPRTQAPPEASAEVTPLSPDRYRYQLTIGGATLEKLRLAKDMLRHALPSGDDEALLDRALTLLLADAARKRFGSEKSARPPRKPGEDSREVPVAVKRAVWVRDLGRCAFVAQDGRRCGERAFVEFHHVHPYAAGGEATVGNIELRCRLHNAYEARLFFPPPADRAFVLERIGASRAASSSTVARSKTSPARSKTSPARPRQALPSPRAAGSSSAAPPVGPSRESKQAMLL